MSIKIIKDIILALLLISIICVCYFPILPGGLTMQVYSVFVVIFAIFAFATWHETSEDEREQRHRSFASRIGFLIGGGVLIAGIVMQGLIDHHIDPWLGYGLAGMVLGRMLGRVWAYYRC